MVKGQKRVLYLEIFLLLTIFLLSFSSFIFYINSYHDDWNELFYKDTPSDLQITITEPYTTFSFISPQLQQSFSSANSFFIINPSSTLFSTSIAENLSLFSFITDTNESFISDVIYLACSSNLLANIVGSTSSDRIYFISSSYVDNTSLISIEFLPIEIPLYLEVTDILLPNELQLFLNTTSSLFDEYIDFDSFHHSDDHNSSYMSPVVLFSTDYFFSLLSLGESELIEHMTSGSSFTSHYHFLWLDKLSYINSLPNYVLKAYEEWMRDYSSTIFSAYYAYHSGYSGIYIVTTSFFIDELLLLNQSYLSSFLSSFSMFIILSSFFLTMFYFYLKQQAFSLKETINFMIIKGAKLNNIFFSLLLLHFMLLFLSFILAFFILFSLSLVFGFYTWSYFYLIIGYILALNVSITFIFEFRVLAFRKTLIYGSPKERTISSSTLTHYITRILTILLAFLLLGVLIIFTFIEAKHHQMLFTLLFLTTSLFLFTISARYIPKLIRVHIHPCFYRLYHKNQQINKFFLQSFTLSYRDFRNFWSILFMVFFLSLFFFSTYKEFNVYESQKQESINLYDFTLVLNDARDVSILENHYNTSNYCLIYHLPNYAYFDRNLYSSIFLLGSPLSFYNSVTFLRESFRSHSNEELFTLLDSSTAFTITDEATSRRLYLKRQEVFSLEYTDRSKNYSVIEERILLDTSKYLPFFSNFIRGHSYFISAYSNNSEFADLFADGLMQAILSIDVSDEDILTSITETLSVNRIAYTFYDENNYSYVFDNDSPLISILRDLTLPLYFLLSLLPILTLSFLIYMYSKFKSYFKFLELRGLRIATSRYSTFTFLASLLLLHLAFTFLFTYIIQLLLWLVMQSIFLMPYVPSSWLYLFITIISIGLSFLFYSLFALKEKTFPFTQVLNHE